MGLFFTDILRKLREGGGLLADIFAQATPRSNNPVKLKRVVAMIDEEDWLAMDVDVKGAAFEGLLEKAASEGKKGAGQYFTPRPLIQAVGRVMKPEPRDKPDFRICDPACGTGGFLAGPRRRSHHRTGSRGGRPSGNRRTRGKGRRRGVMSDGSQGRKQGKEYP